MLHSLYIALVHFSYGHSPGLGCRPPTGVDLALGTNGFSHDVTIQKRPCRTPSTLQTLTGEEQVINFMWRLKLSLFRFILQKICTAILHSFIKTVNVYTRVIWSPLNLCFLRRSRMLQTYVYQANPRSGLRFEMRWRRDKRGRTRRGGTLYWRQRLLAYCCTVKKCRFLPVNLQTEIVMSLGALNYSIVLNHSFPSCCIYIY